MLGTGPRQPNRLAHGLRDPRAALAHGLRDPGAARGFHDISQDRGRAASPASQASRACREMEYWACRETGSQTSTRPKAQPHWTLWGSSSCPAGSPRPERGATRGPSVTRLPTKSSISFLTLLNTLTNQPIVQKHLLFFIKIGLNKRSFIHSKFLWYKLNYIV